MPERPEKRSRTDEIGRFGDTRHFAEVSSTNQVVADAAARGAAEGLVVVADRQTAGRGRLGRRWETPPGEQLLVSVLLRPDLPPERLHLLTAAAALSAADALAATTGLNPALKWPNDLLLDGLKVAGILAEASSGAVVVGVGVNLDWPEVPDELVGVATACNLAGGRPVTRDELLEAFLVDYDARLDDVEAVAREYRRRLATLGRRVRVERSDGDVVGTAVDVSHAGLLLVEVDVGCIVEIAAGDVVHLRTG